MDNIAIKTEKTGFRPKKEDIQIVNFLMNDGRATLKEISKHVGLSIDAVKDHIDKMRKAGAIDRFTIHVDPKFFGLALEAHVYVKFKNVTEQAVKEFIEYITKHPRIITIISMLGNYDIFFVIAGRDAEDLEYQKIKLRERFKDLIDNWDEAVASKIRKLEFYRFDE